MTTDCSFIFLRISLYIKYFNIWLFFKYDPSMALGQRNGATVNDLRKVNVMYNCNGAGMTPNINTNTNSGENQGNSFHIF